LIAKVDLHAGVKDHANERVEGKPADLPAFQIRDPGLTQPQPLGRIGLLPTFLLDELPPGHHHL
jgi:hypothetical protein